VIVARFHEDVTDRLLEGALRALDESKVSRRSITVISVPGSFELPGAAQQLARAGKVSAIVCLGAVIRGETDHYHFVASAAEEGVLRVGLETGIPVTFGVLTGTLQQAMERSGGKRGNKGYDAARDAVEMANLYDQVR
jgi:6,7-dimethyl-8-ribityllumazine synthase